MATISEIRSKKNELEERILQYSKKHPGEGCLTFAQGMLEKLGHGDLSCGTMEEISQSIEKLSKNERKVFNIGMNAYRKAEEEAIEDLTKTGSIQKIKRLAKSTFDVFSKGAVVGFGATQGLLKVFPNIGSVISGVMIGQQHEMNLFEKIAYMGAASTELPQWALLAAGTLAGVATLAIGKGVKAGFHAIKDRKSKPKHEPEI